MSVIRTPLGVGKYDLITAIGYMYSRYENHFPGNGSYISRCSNNWHHCTKLIDYGNFTMK